MTRIRTLTAFVAAGFLLVMSLSPADAQSRSQLDELARSVERSESLRSVKTLQRTYAQYAQFGLWDEIGALFATDGEFVFDGQITEEQSYSGGPAVAEFLRNRYGAGEDGLAADGLSTMLIENPVINLAADGQIAQGRWNVLIFYGAGADARIEGGIFENEYARRNGVWQITKAHYYPQFAGTYDAGWTNWGGGDLPMVPYHFDPDGAGIPIAPANAPPPRSAATLADLQARVDRMNDEDRVRSLQAAYGYYQDRRMWDDVVDLFAADGVVEVGGQGVWHGTDGVRRWLESNGSQGLSHGQLNDQVQFDVTVTVSPDGSEAWARGIDLGMLGEADDEQGWWQVTTFANRFVKEAGVWKLRELRLFPLMKTDIFEGWGRSRIVKAAPSGVHAPDAPSTVEPSAVAMPVFLAPHPVTGEPVVPVGAAVTVATTALSPQVASAATQSATLEEVQRRLDRAEAWDGIENVSAAFGYYLDDSMPRGFGGLMAENGAREAPFVGYYISRERIIEARDNGPPPATRPGISYHWLMQPVMQISNDGRSAKGRLRLFQPRTGREVGEAGAFFGASFWGGMYHNRFVLEDGVWKIWEVTLDEPLIVPVSWEDGLWAKAKDPDPATLRRSFTGGRFPPDIANIDLGRREEHFWGGPGETWQWPTIVPMFFSYTNPVSGRVPEFYQPTCVPCAIRPDLALEANGYQEPPDAPEANTAP